MAVMEAKLKNDMTRIARKEARLLIAPLLKRIATQRKEIADLKSTRVKASGATRVAGSKPRAPSKVSIEDARSWFTSTALVELRSHLDLSAAEMARLINSSPWSIYQWESGKNPNPEFLVKLASLRKISKRRARQLLEATEVH